LSRSSLPKKQRHRRLLEIIESSPFMTDEELAEKLNVSIPTIRLDRLELNVPELRQRIKNVAAENHIKVKALKTEEIFGEIIDLELNVRGISMLETTDEMVFRENEIVRGHYIYSMAESLAMSVIDASVALVGVANIKYKIPVSSGAKLIAKAEVKSIRRNNHIVWVFIYEKQMEVFRGKFILVSVGKVNNND